MLIFCCKSALSGELMGIIIDNTIYDTRPVEKRTDIEEKSYDFLEQHHIKFNRIDHEEANTIAACHEIESYLGSDICKNLFLKNSAKTKFFLLLMDGNKKFDSKVISHQIGSTRLSFASSEDMLKYLGLHPGSVSVMGLINDTSKSVQLLIDSSLLKKEYFCCHPCKNTSTLKFKTKDIINIFLCATEHDFIEVNI